MNNLLFLKRFIIHFFNWDCEINLSSPYLGHIIGNLLKAVKIELCHLIKKKNKVNLYKYDDKNKPNHH